MKKIILAAILAFAPVTAHAGSVSISVTNAANGTLTKTFNVPDAHLVRWIAAYQSAADASIGGTANRAQVLNYIANSVMQSWVSAVQVFETTVATINAGAGVTPITAN